MKIRFTITLSKQTVRGFSSEGASTSKDVLNIVVAHVRDLLNDMTDKGEDEDEDSTDEDTDVE